MFASLRRRDGAYFYVDCKERRSRLEVEGVRFRKMKKERNRYGTAGDGVLGLGDREDMDL
jgi:hypothetical protein